MTGNVEQKDDHNQEISDVTKDFVWVRLPKPNDFLKVKETLTRIGVASTSKKELYQSCAILHKRGHFAIVHFKEMFLLDGKKTNFNEEDLARRNTIANLLDEWGLVEIIDKEKTKSPVCPLNKIKVLSYKEKSEWTLISKYSIGTKKKVATDV